jgi:hypothetical protein
MARSLTAATWLPFAEREYLASFVREGGSAVKFVAALDEAERAAIGEQLFLLGREHGYLGVRIDASETRVHMADQVFYRVAEALPWEELSRRVIVALAGEAGYAPVDPVGSGVLERLAEANRIEADVLRMDLRRTLGARVLRRPDLAKQFRVAATQLCLADLDPGPAGAMMSQAIQDWLTGRNRAISAVKLYNITSPINRANARYFFESLLRWIRFAGLPGLVIVVDIQRLAVPRNPRDGAVFYSKAALLDAYELLREFVDSTDRMEGCFVAVITDAEFLDDDPYGRGMGAYEALKFRVFDEIRDRALVNPMASLIRLAGDGSADSAEDSR